MNIQNQIASFDTVAPSIGPAPCTCEADRLGITDESEEETFAARRVRLEVEEAKHYIAEARRMIEDMRYSFDAANKPDCGGFTRESNTEGFLKEYLEANLVLRLAEHSLDLLVKKPIRAST